MSLSIQQSRNGKVLHYCDGPLFERSETFIHNLISGLRGWDIALCAPARINETEFPLDSVPFFPVWQPKNWFLWKLDLLFRARMRLADPVISRIVRKTHPQVIHAHFGWSGDRMELVCRRRQIPLAVSFYGADATRKPASRRSLGCLYKPLFSAARWVFAEGPHLAETLLALGCPRDRIHILRIAIPVSRIKFRSRNYDPERPLHLLHCGRFVPKKGLLILLEALADLKKGGLALELRVIGDGPLRSNIEQAVASLGLQSVVKLLGSQPREVFWKELACCDILVVPSTTGPDGDSEGGAPTVLLEAQASGVPIVATDHADIPFVIAPAGEAPIASQGSVAALTGALRECIAKGAKWTAMGEAGMRFVQKHHDIPVVASELEALYNEAMQAPARSERLVDAQR